ncbi:tetraketide alpha-pyrone reductase 2-like isoform X2 [Prosopis cineraria]|uniref:tetraketide alpha-pyrone reductase 2-like isoform X2 n=1 Tax=Prosopis cineraria TaxID=364024 RepID=UPI0024108B7E|nr:tetraketide alpha-pyrone reductase 2-like isoform X2 [Prosopis cineraria]
MPEYCVTGGSGFIAAYLIKALLRHGHSVRTTVRNPDDVEKYGFLWDLSGAKERLGILKANLLEEGSFHEAVKGVDGVFHTASPVFVPDDDNIQHQYALLIVLKTCFRPIYILFKTTLIDPAIKGTVNVLNSCITGQVKRVVLTSSCSSIRYRDDVQQQALSSLNESHWSDLEYCKRYNTMAEKEAWRIAKESGLDLVVVNPSFVVGPLLAPKPTSTLLAILSIVKGLKGEYPNTTVGFVHIDDVIAAHLLAMEEPRASGCRLICSSSVAHWSHVMKMLQAQYPSYPYENKCGSQEGDNNPHSMDTTKIAELGFPPFKTLEEMFGDCIKSFQEKGFL